MYTIYTEDGVLPKTQDVVFTNIQLHIKSEDRFADEARCLLSFYVHDHKGDPIAWNFKTKQLIYDEADVAEACVRVKIVRETDE